MNDAQDFLGAVVAASDITSPQLVQLCITDHSESEIPHLHVQVHLRAGPEVESSAWARLDVSVDELRVAARELSPSVRFHMHRDGDAPKASPPCSSELLDGLCSSAHALTDCEATWLVDQEHGCCPICLLDVEEGDEIVCLPCVGMHISHKACIRPWLEKASTCPTCRFELPTQATPDTIENLIQQSIAGLARLTTAPDPSSPLAAAETMFDELPIGATHSGVVAGHPSTTTAGKRRPTFWPTRIFRKSFRGAPSSS